jgi:hypothetical protein
MVVTVLLLVEVEVVVVVTVLLLVEVEVVVVVVTVLLLVEVEVVVVVVSLPRTVMKTESARDSTDSCSAAWSPAQGPLRAALENSFDSTAVCLSVQAGSGPDCD